MKPTTHALATPSVARTHSPLRSEPSPTPARGTVGFYGPIYDRLYRRGYHSNADYSHAQALCQVVNDRFRPASVLDVGCSHGWTMEFFAMRGVRAVGIDASEVAVRRARRLGRDARLASATDLPFDDGAFDLVLSTDCLEHMRPDDAPRAVAEMSRVAVRWIAIKVNPRPDRNRWWRWLAGTPLHLTCEPVANWLERFAREGFDPVHTDHANEQFVLERRDRTGTRRGEH
jgi:SAM-dependent methyltransferase